MEALLRDFDDFPPLEMTVAAFAGYKGKQAAKTERMSLKQFRQMWGAGP